MAQDFRYVLRMLGNDPGFTAVAIMTIALGIGANTAIFSLMNAFVLRPLRVKDPSQLVMITEARLKQRGRRNPTEAAYLEWKLSSHSFEDIAFAGFDGDPTTLSGSVMPSVSAVASAGSISSPCWVLKRFADECSCPRTRPTDKAQQL